MSKAYSAILIAALTVGITACATPPAPAPKVAAAPECVFPGSDKAAPLWVCDAPVEGMAIGAVGSAQKSEAGIDFMKQMAATSARVQLAQRKQVQVQNMIKQFAETTGTAGKETVDKVNTIVTKQITAQTLEGTQLFRSIQAPDGTMFVLVGMSPASDEKNTVKAVKEAMNTSKGNDAAAWQQFRGQKGQDELASEIAKQKVDSAKQ